MCPFPMLIKQNPRTDPRLTTDDQLEVRSLKRRFLSSVQNDYDSGSEFFGCLFLKNQTKKMSLK